MALYALAALILAQDSVSVPLAVLGCVVLGLASGAMGVIVACLITRLFASAIFGVVYGSLMSLSVLAAAIGPLVVSQIHDSTGSYAIAFWSGGAIAVVAALLLLGLAPAGEEPPAKRAGGGISR
jgi:MFS family permease